MAYIDFEENNRRDAKYRSKLYSKSDDSKSGYSKETIEFLLNKSKKKHVKTAKNIKQSMPPSWPLAGPLRSREVQLADMQTRFDQMERIANKPEILYPCTRCRFYSAETCTNALVTGFGNEVFTELRLCGPERALWQPRLGLINRIIALVKSRAMGLAGFCKRIGAWFWTP